MQRRSMAALPIAQPPLLGVVEAGSVEAGSVEAGSVEGGSIEGGSEGCIPSPPASPPESAPSAAPRSTRKCTTTITAATTITTVAAAATTTTLALPQFPVASDTESCDSGGQNCNAVIPLMPGKPVMIPQLDAN